jgi:alpha-D-xyloside xylohydrolase
VPFFYSLAEAAYASEQDRPIIGPQVPAANAAGDYRYLLGDAFLVAPILDATGRRDVVLPPGASYVDWWAQGSSPLAGGTTLADYDSTQLDRMPLFLRSGAIVPMHVDTDAFGLGSSASGDALTVLAYPGAAASTFTLYEADDSTTTLTLNAGRFEAARLTKRLRLRARVEAPPTTVEKSGAALSALPNVAALDSASGAEGYVYDAATKSLWITVGSAAAPVALSWR